MLQVQSTVLLHIWFELAVLPHIWFEPIPRWRWSHIPHYTSMCIPHLPSINQALIHKPCKLFLWQHSMLQVQPAVSHTWSLILSHDVTGLISQILLSWAYYTHHPSTRPWSTNHVSFLFDSTVCCRFSLLYSQTCGFRNPSASMIQKYWSSRSWYSVVRNTWVTPSTLSTIGQAKSYVG